MNEKQANKSTTDIEDLHSHIYTLNREMGEVKETCKIIKWGLGLNLSLSIGILALLIKSVI